MAKAKKMKEEIEVVEVKDVEVKDVDFGELELKIEKPKLNADKTLSIGGNFSELGKNIQKVVDRYKGVKLTEDNIEYVTTLKKQFASLRLGIERERKEYKKVYISPAEDLIDSMCKELQKIVDEGESALGAQLEEYDQRRKDELTEIMSDYVKDFSKKYGLREEYEAQIQLKKQYYNKTQKEEDTIEDIELQAQELAKKQKEYDNGVALIKAECEDAGLLPDSYIRELDYKVATEIILEIKQDKKSREAMLKQAEEGEKIEIGADADSEIAKQIAKATKLSKEEKRTRLLRITYAPSLAKTIASFFESAGIEYEFVKQDF